MDKKLKTDTMEPEDKNIVRLTDPFERVGDQLKCKACGAIHALYECKCGKYGTLEQMQRHIDNRHAKKTEAAFRNHQIISDEVVTEEIVTEEPKSVYEEIVEPVESDGENKTLLGSLKKKRKEKRK